MAQTEFFARARNSRSVTFARFVGLDRLVGLWRSRQALSRLDSDALADIGVTPQDAQKEAARPVWDVPHNWRN